MTNIKRVVYVALLLTCFCVHAGDGFDIGIRWVGSVGDGVPGNDRLGSELFGRYWFNPAWGIGFAVGESEFDFEKPAKHVGLVQDPNNITDAKAESTDFNFWVERRFIREGSKWEPFVLGGLGISNVDVTPATGPLLNGGQFTVVTTADDETLFTLSGGTRFFFARQWAFEGIIGLTHHDADWKLLELNTGNTGSIGSYTEWHLKLGVNFRFD